MAKSICKLIVTLVVSILIANVLMISVYGIPTDRMFSHAKANADLFGNSYIDTWAPGIPSATLSYSTDAIMINNAIYQDNKSSVYNAMMNPRYEDGTGNVANSLFQVLNYDKLQDIKPQRAVMTPVDSFRDDDNTAHELETMYYPRYWHGYLLFLKPMLLVLDVSEIKLLMMAVQILLAAITLFLINRKIGTGVAFAFLTSLIVLNPVTAALTFQENTIYILTLICAFLILMFNDRLIRKDNYCVYFIIWGSVTCFFDFLTYPLVTLGIPLCIVVLLNHNSFRTSFLNIIKCSAAWSIGYVGLWLGKFVSCTIVTDYNLLVNSAKSVLFRMGVDNLGNDQLDTTFLTALKINIFPIINWISLLIILIVIVACIVLYKYGYRREPDKGRFACLLLLSLYPIVWYAGTKNHAYIHYYMTYRELAITWFCIASIALYKWEKTALSHQDIIANTSDKDVL